MKFNGNDLIEAGIPAGPYIGRLLKILNSGNYTKQSLVEISTAFVNLKFPKMISVQTGSRPVCLDLLKVFFDYEAEHKKNKMALHESPIPYKAFGIENIEQGAIEQMNNAMRLPVSIAGALAPDSHSGYSMPIGGILATDNVVIPNAVGG